MDSPFYNNFIATTNATSLDVMVDLETTDNKCTSAIASIGACTFDQNGIWSKFYVVVDVDTCKAAGMSESQGTLEWWSKQSPQARQIFNSKTPKMSLTDALTAFAHWYKAARGKCFWGNGADFDNAIMAYAYGLVGIKQPWNFGDNRCFRTIKNGAYMTTRKGVYHNALDDAITQAQYMIDHNLIPK